MNLNASRLEVRIKERISKLRIDINNGRALTALIMITITIIAGLLLRIGSSVHSRHCRAVEENLAQSLHDLEVNKVTGHEIKQSIFILEYSRPVLLIGGDVAEATSTASEHLNSRAEMLLAQIAHGHVFTGHVHVRVDQIIASCMLFKVLDECEE